MLGFWATKWHNIACPKNDRTTVFVAQSTDPPIKNGVIIIIGKQAWAHGLKRRSGWRRRCCTIEQKEPIFEIFGNYHAMDAVFYLFNCTKLCIKFLRINLFLLSSVSWVDKLLVIFQVSRTTGFFRNLDFLHAAQINRKFQYNFYFYLKYFYLKYFYLN